jgi:hypothetical protein
MAITEWESVQDRPKCLGASRIIFDVVDNVIATPSKFGDVEEITPFLRDVQESLLEAIDRSIPPHHPLNL